MLEITEFTTIGDNGGDDDGGRGLVGVGVGVGRRVVGDEMTRDQI